MANLVQNEKIEITTAVRKEYMIETKLALFFKKTSINEIMPIDVQNGKHMFAEKAMKNTMKNMVIQIHISEP